MTLLLYSTAVSNPKQMSKIGMSRLMPFRMTHTEMANFLLLIYLWSSWHRFMVLLAPIRYSWFTFLLSSESMILEMCTYVLLRPR